MSKAEQSSSLQTRHFVATAELKLPTMQITASDLKVPDCRNLKTTAKDMVNSTENKVYESE